MASILPTAPVYYTTNVQPSIRRMIAGATITAGQMVYEDTAANGVAKLADSTTSDATSQCIGMAMNSGISGGPIEVCTDGEVSVAATPFSPGTVMILNTTAGSMADHADLVTATTWRCTICGVATANNRMRIRPFASLTVNP